MLVLTKIFVFLIYIKIFSVVVACVFLTAFCGIRVPIQNKTIRRPTGWITVDCCLKSRRNEKVRLTSCDRSTSVWFFAKVYDCAARRSPTL